MKWQWQMCAVMAAILMSLLTASQSGAQMQPVLTELPDLNFYWTLLIEHDEQEVIRVYDDAGADPAAPGVKPDSWAVPPDIELFVIPSVSDDLINLGAQLTASGNVLVGPRLDSLTQGSDVRPATVGSTATVPGLHHLPALRVRR
jgi:hypothetical protein